MTSAEPVAGRVSLTYNADGQRVKKEAPGQVVKFLYDFEKVLQESDGADAVQKEYTSTVDQPVRQHVSVR